MNFKMQQMPLLLKQETLSLDLEAGGMFSSAENLVCDTVVLYLLGRKKSQ